MPETVQKQYEAIVSIIDLTPKQPEKERLCQSYITAIHEEKFDLKNNDP